MAWARKRGKGYSIGYVDKFGVPVEKTAKTANKREALQMAEELEHKHRRIRLGIDPDTVDAPTFGELVAAYVKGPASRLRSFATIDQRIRDHLMPAFKERRADQITGGDVDELLVAKLKEGYGPQTVDHMRIAMSGVYTYGIEKLKRVRNNPAAEATPVPIPAHEPKVLDAQHVPALVANVHGRWRNLFATAVYTGLRKGELLGLPKANVDLELRRIWCANSYEGETKSGKPRLVPIPEELVPFLSDAMKQSKDEFLFPALDGGMQNRNANLPRTFRNALKRAGIVEGYRLKCRRGTCGWESKELDPEAKHTVPCPTCGFLLFPKAVALDLSFKDLRSTYGTYLYEATDDIRLVQRNLGHHDPKLTERVYAKLTAQKALQQADRLKFGAALLALPTGTLPTSTHDAKGETVEGTVLQKQLQELTATRSRGLEPLTFGVTGRIDCQSPRNDEEAPVTLNHCTTRSTGRRLTLSHRTQLSITGTLPTTDGLKQ